MPNSNHLFKDSWSPRTKVLQDGVDYRFIIESSCSHEGTRYLRNRVYEYEVATEHWKLIVDTGDVLDHNRWADLTKDGVVFAHVFPSNLSAWSIDIKNIKVVWGPYIQAGTDNTGKLSKYGADLDGDLRFVSASRKIGLYNEGTNPSTWTAIQGTTANKATLLQVLPNGTATEANINLLNRSSLTGPYQSLGLAMSGSQGILSVGGANGSGNPDLLLRVGGTVVGTATASGFKILNAATPIGPVTTRITGSYNWAGTNARASASSSLNLESLCTSGGISSMLVSLGGTQEQKVEYAVRPVLSILSCLLQDLRDRKVI